MPSVSKFELIDESIENSSPREVIRESRSVSISHSEKSAINRPTTDSPSETTEVHDTSTGSSTEPENLPPKKTKDKKKITGSFQSFSEGLPSVQKFEILGAPVKPGQVLSMSLAEFISSRHFPLESPLKFGHSKSLQKIDRYRTLGLVLERAEIVPWSEKIKVDIRHHQNTREYCFDTDTIYISAALPPQEQLLEFIHQAYHATNKLLSHLYVEEPIDIEEFVDLHLWSEIAALITEVNAATELKEQDRRMVLADCLEPDGSIIALDVERFIQHKGMRELRAYLSNGLVRGSMTEGLVARLSGMYESYRALQASPDTRRSTAAQIEYCLSRGLELDSI